jgi:hypothetical protein
MKIHMNHTHQPIANDRGQMTIEAILILTIMVGIFTMVHKTMKSGDYMAKLVSGPWSYVQGMTENGVWASAANGRRKHPNSYSRRASPEPI